MGGFFGYATDNNRHWFSSYRVDVEGTHTLSKSSVRGNWAYTLHLPANHYRYSYDLAIATLGANFGVDVYRWEKLALFLQAGAGLDWLKTQNFNATPERNQLKF